MKRRKAAGQRVHLSSWHVVRDLAGQCSARSASSPHRRRSDAAHRQSCCGHRTALLIMPYHPMKKYMDKIDDWGSTQSKKVSASRDAGAAGGSFSDRLNAARGKDNRWETPRSQDLSAGDAAVEENVVPNRTARVGHLPPAPPSATGSRAAGVPPPPQRAAGVPLPPPTRASTAAVPQPASAAPSLPRRMDNENGTAHPPPPYPTAKPPLPTRTPSQSTESNSNSSAFAFSTFDEEDKQEGQHEGEE